jgi:hypothetical protein
LNSGLVTFEKKVSPRADAPPPLDVDGCILSKISMIGEVSSVVGQSEKYYILNSVKICENI